MDEAEPRKPAASPPVSADGPPGAAAPGRAPLVLVDRPPQDAGEHLRHVRQPLAHDSARKHVQGLAQYIDDIREPEGTLHLAIGQAPKARGKLLSLDVSAVRAVPGVVAVLTAADIPGPNDVSPAFGDDPMFAERDIGFHGQAVFAVAAVDRDVARRAAKLFDELIVAVYAGREKPNGLFTV